MMIGSGWRLCGALALVLAAAPNPASAASGAGDGPSEVVFLAQIILLLVCGRLLGEAMQRIGQPPIMGQLIAGILLGPSVLGALAPDVQAALFPTGKEQAAMIAAVSQLGILMLLLLTGMETDFSLVRRAGRTAASVSVAGIAVPFACGLALGEMLPESMLPNPEQRFITSLFLGTALAISSVKIVALTIRDLGFMRRMLGQVTVAAAIIDDTIGWIIIAITIGIAQHGSVDLASLTKTVFGTLVFLAVSFTIGRRLVFLLIRWANDNFVSEVPVITAILVVMGVMSLITHWIGVHTILGAFVAGMLVGQSPILTRHIDAQLRGLIAALFMPVFFGLAGLSANIAVLEDPSILLLSLLLILIASVGKFGGAFIGGAAGGMSWRESVALGCGMNARGSTEVIVATIGLTAGALSQTLFTMILSMALVTTMAMPPMLRWALARVPLGEAEKERLEREEFEAQGFVTNMERLLVVADESPSGRFASRLAGLLAGSRRIPMTILRTAAERGAGRALRARTAAEVPVEALAKEMADAAQPDTPDLATALPPIDITARPPDKPVDEAVAQEARKGYDFLVVGIEPIGDEGSFDDRLASVAGEFDGPLAVTAARGRHRRAGVRRRGADILVPVTGTAFSRHGAEVALALARADHGTVTALYVAASAAQRWHRRFGPSWATGADEAAILREIVDIGDRLGVAVRTAVRSSAPHEATAADAILRELQTGRYNLVVMGVSPRPGPTLSYGAVAAALLARSERSLLFVAS
jgi:Kef-type K+ transport system membrane component KefB/nucleotide-binding universal stress UspA family protein